MSEWISVEDRLPDESRPEVLFYIGFLRVVELGKYNEAVGKWRIAHFDEYDVPTGGNGVTHWMPLPPPPLQK